MKSKILYGALAFVLSFALWLYVVTVVSPESEDTYYDVPIVLDGESLLADRGLMLVSGAEQTVTLKLEGNRSDLTKLNKSNITLLVDISGITTAGEHMLSFTPSYPGIVQSGTLTVLDSNPKLITVVVAERETKNIPIRLTYTGQVAENYIVDKQNAKLDNTTVQISGPKELIDQIDHAQINVDLTDKNATVSEYFRYTLCDAAGEPVQDVRNVTTNLEKIKVTVGIQKMKEIHLTVDKIFGGGVTENTCKIELSVDTIQVSGSDAALEKLDTLLLGSIDLAEILESTTQLTFPIVLPDGITCLSGETEVTVTVTLQNLEIREYTVVNFQKKNLPDGLDVSIIDKMKKVLLRGTAAELENITAEDIFIVVDFSNAETGTQTYEATILVDGGGTAGAVGTYLVTANVQLQPDEI